MARTFRRVEGRLRPQFDAGTGVDAHVLLSASAANPFRVEDVGSGVGVEVTLDGARDVDAQVSDGYVVYPRAHRTGATLLHRALPSGLEDYLSFERRPPHAVVAYVFAPGSLVKGLRLVENTLELVDAAGAPRLRVAPPYVIGADGARTEAALAVEGCAVDHNPAAPWGRPVTAPGSARCTLRVSWRDADVSYPAILDPRWTTTTGTMTIKRQGHTATLLSNGKVLVAGGTDGANPLASAELFDRTTNSWAATGSFTGARQLHTAVQLGANGNTTTSGKVLLAGGWSGGTLSSGAAVNTAQLYNATAGTWSTATSLGSGTTGARHSHTATVLSNGQVLVAGGLSDAATTVLNTASTFDPTSGTGTWTATSAMASKARFHTATLMTTGAFANKVVVVGGNTGGTTNTAVVQVFTAGASPAWTSAGIAQLPAAREGHTATLLANGQLLITGGKSGAALQTSTLLFNNVSPGTWTSAGTMGATHLGHTATLLGTSTLKNGQVLVAGGAPSTTNSAELWNGTSTWAPTTSLSTVISGHKATLLANNMVLLTGGVTGTTTLNTAQLYDPSFALICTTNSQCATGFCVSGVCCDTACNGGCGACNLTGKVGTCSPVASATVCRAPAGTCDVAETCNGTALTCPADAFVSSATTCRATSGACDVAEKCTGTSAACPADGFAASTVVCRAAAGTCDVAEKCTGTTAACPADAFAPSATTCRASTGACDPAEKCTGSAAGCPADLLASATTVCRAAAGACDVAETCTGSSGVCPADVLATSATVCRAAAGACDVAEKCTGSSASCPTDAFVSSATVCRASAGACDVAEKCTGTTGACPADALVPAGTTCRASAGACDVVETCSGSAAGCPSDQFLAASTVCRAATGQCDRAETCSGSTATCPADAVVTCAAPDQCHLATTCNPATGACGSPPAKPNGAICDDANGATEGETCQVGACRAPTSYPTVSQLPVEDIGDLGGHYSSASGINNLGEVVGYGAATSGASHAFAWRSPGPMLDLGADPSLAPSSSADGVNDAGDIVGTIYEADGSTHAFRSTSFAGVEDLGVGGDNSVATDVFPYRGSLGGPTNNAGQFAGSFTKNSQMHGFRYAEGLGFEDIGSLAGGLTYAFGISDDGTIVGSSWVPGTPAGSSPRRLGHAVLYHDSSVGLVDLNNYVDPASGWVLRDAASISADGRYIVGDGERGGLLRVFRLNTSTGVIDEVSGNWLGDSLASTVNSSGDVVGSGKPDGTNARAAFIYTDELGFKKLNDLIDPSSGWNLQNAVGINEAGEVVGWGGYLGQTRAFRLRRIMTPQLACAGKQDGDACDAGTFCPRNNVCFHGACGGTDPVDAVCLHVDGVVNDHQGRPIALFGYDNTSGSTVIPTVNQELVNGTVVVAPKPEPPPWLETGSHTAAFKPMFASGQTVSWRVGGQKATATSTPTLVATDGAHCVETQIGDAAPICVEPLFGQFTTPPSDPTTGSGPNTGDADPGRLSGSLTVTPSGAAIYKVPIAIPPGIGGMAPNLSLVYNSQGGDGLAGQGWELAGLSMVHLCPKTRTQDGVSEQVDLTTTPPKGGVCLDGARLFVSTPAGAPPSVDSAGRNLNFYKLEIDDHSLITRHGDDLFTVETKNGETRYYGYKTTSRVSLTAPGSGVSQVGIWALDRVVDQWGNYYTYTYNGESADFQSRGLIVTKIDYTGHMAGAASQLDPFASVSFTYSGGRKDPRSMRFGQVSIPRNQLLQQITTSSTNQEVGHYELAYKTGQTSVDDSMLPTQLEKMRYCPSPRQPGAPVSPCTDWMTFEWQGGGFSMVPNDAYAPPGPVDVYYNQTAGHLVPHGYQFADLNGDGRVDFIQAAASIADGHAPNLHAWWNDGTAFVPKDEWSLPNNLWDNEGDPAGAVLADMNGDGMLDYIQNHNTNAFCPVGDASNCPNPNIQIYINEIKKTSGSCTGAQCWQPLPGFATLPTDGGYVWGNVNLDSLDNKDYLVDMDGDGRADLARIVPTKQVDPTCLPLKQVCAVDKGDLRVLLNKASGWVATTQYSFATSALRGHIDKWDGHGYHLEDINRDGLTDLVANTPDSVPGGAVYYVGVNTGRGDNVWSPTTIAASPNRDTTDPSAQQFGDIDGDGQFDSIRFYDLKVDFGGNPPHPMFVNRNPAVAMNTAIGYTTADPIAGSFLASLGDAGPPPPTGDVVQAERYRFAFGMTDLNADGLADVVVGKSGGVRAFPNAGDHWRDCEDAPPHQTTAGNHALPVIPFVAYDGQFDRGAQFIDLNGDGIVDLVHSTNDPVLTRHAWINTFKPPLITKFPNGLARPTEVAYETISTKTARDHGTYDDAQAVDVGTTVLTPPLRVVANAAQEDGRGIGLLATTTYQYRAFRGSAVGRGAQGFKTTNVFDPSDTSDPTNGTIGTTTTTTYSQVFPYTGMPISFTRSKGTTTLSTTTTRYCDTIFLHFSSCSSQEQADMLSPIGSGTTRPVYTLSTDETTNLIGSNETSRTTTSMTHDGQGNQTRLEVDVSRSDGDAYSTTTTMKYGATEEQRLGMVTDMTVEKRRGNSSVTHETTFVNDYFGGFVGEDNVTHRALALKTKTAEPLANLDDHVTAETAYDYDPFGHVIVETACASDFDSCVAGGSNPADYDQSADHGLHPSFRTTRTSYDSSSLNYVTGTGITPVVGYASGRFPVSSTNAEGDTESYAYDAVRGLLLQKVAANGLRTCNEYDDLGRQTSITDRCGSAAPLKSTTDRFLSGGFSGDQFKLVTVTRGPSGAASWAYSDVLGRNALTLTRAFDGGLIAHGQTNFDVLGRQTAEFAVQAFVAGPPLYPTSHTYDRMGLEVVTERQLGDLGGPNTAATSHVTRSYQGSTIVTQEVITQGPPEGSNEPGTRLTRTRTEKKDGAGRVSQVIDTTNGTVGYTYDTDGNVITTTLTPADGSSPAVVSATWDLAGRKTSTTDPDLGTWSYVCNGFGELVKQTDAKLAETTMTYDILGRMKTKKDDSGTAQWFFETSGVALGQLSAVIGAPDPKLHAPCSIPGLELDGNRATKRFAYTAFGNVSDTVECVDGVEATTTNEYDDSKGRLSRILYPSIGSDRLAVRYSYTSLGYLQFLSDDASQKVLWQVKAMDAGGRISDEETANGVETLENHNASTGWLMGSQSLSRAQDDLLIQNWTYRYDEAGNLMRRQRADSTLPDPSIETFAYDPLDRLTSARVEIDSGGPRGYDRTETYQYNGAGNLLVKSNVTQTYGSCSAGTRPAGLHALCTVGDSAPFSYDDNGSLLAGNGRTLEYNPGGRPVRVVDSASSAAVSFAYGADGNRVAQDVETPAQSGVASARTLYFGLGGTGKSLYERKTASDGSVEHTQFIYAGASHGGNAFAVRTTTVSSGTASTPALGFYHFDHLGSVTAISDGQGLVTYAAWDAGADATVMGYDAWGARRAPDGRAADAKAFHPQAGHREYTGHETVPGVGLVNMNGRLYDPAVARFAAADPTVQAPDNLQSFNRYAYVLNNPLKYTDPTGFRSHHVFGPNADQDIGVTLQALSIALITVPYAGEIALAANVAWTGITMKAGGAGWDQIAVVAAIEIGAYALGRGLAPAAEDVTSHVVSQAAIAGSISAAQSIMIAGVTGSELNAGDILMGATEAAFLAGLFEEARYARVSQNGASKGGNGEAERLARCGCPGDNPDSVRNHVRDEAIRRGQVKTATIDKLTVRVYGETDAQRGAAMTGLRRVFSTPQGGAELNALEARIVDGGPEIKPLDVVLVRSGGSYTYVGSQTITLDINDLGAAYPSRWAGGVYNYERIFAHEIGHAAMGIRDQPLPLRMLNVNTNENPIMRSLGDLNDRMAY